MARDADFEVPYRRLARVGRGLPSTGCEPRVAGLCEPPIYEPSPLLGRVGDRAGWPNLPYPRLLSAAAEGRRSSCRPIVGSLLVLMTVLLRNSRLVLRVWSVDVRNRGSAAGAEHGKRSRFRRRVAFAVHGATWYVEKIARSPLNHS